MSRDSKSNILPLGSIAEVFSGYLNMYPRMRKDAPGEMEERQGLTAASLTDGRINPDKVETIQAPPGLLEKHQLHAGDVLIPSRAMFANLRVVLVPPEYDGHIITSQIVCVRLGDQLYPSLLAAYFNHPVGQAALQSVSQSTTAQMNISVRHLKTLEVPIPQKSEQKKLAAMIEAAEAAYHHAVDAADARRTLTRQIVFNRMNGGK